MTVPTGLLEWGQPGTFNARDDRNVITALANGKVGIVKAATFTAGSGLAMTVGPFSAIVDCGDSTATVAASTINQTVTLLAGPTSGSRTDIIWLDIDPDGSAQWSINIRTQADTVGRLGVKLGQVVMPQNASLASQATLQPSGVSWAPWPQPITKACVGLIRTAATSVTSSTNLQIGSASAPWQAEELGAPGTQWSTQGFIAPAAGLYLVTGRCLWVTSVGGFRAASVVKNGTLQPYSETRLAGPTTTANYSSSLIDGYVVKCVAGDVVSIQIYQNTGAALSTIQIGMNVAQQQ